MNRICLMGIFPIILTMVLTGCSSNAPKNNVHQRPAAAQPSPSVPVGSQVIVLEFHDVSPDTSYPPYEHRAGQDPAIETPGELDDQLQALLDNGYHVISLAAFHKFLRGEATVPVQAVLLTFDDGYEDTYKYATPLLEKYNLTATMFMITGWWDPDAHMRAYWHYVSAAEAERMLGSGVWSFGGHTYNGHYQVWTGPDGTQTGWFYSVRKYLPDQHRMETTAEYAQRILADATKMTAELKKVGVADPVDFAWPDGRSTSTARNILTGLGYRYFFLQEPGVNRPDPRADTWNIYRVYPGFSAGSMLAAIREAEH
ncbi:MAG: polysaccharide deacetylase family protein [Peptococcaceae bacterium]|nr:polysaccharide deacetylase family protein [Peptococcaceae bacterium]